MSRQLVLVLNTEMAERYYFIEHTEDYLNVFIWVAPGLHTLAQSIMHILQVVHYTFMHLFLLRVFEKFNDNRVSNNENINKVHDLPGHPFG